MLASIRSLFAIFMMEGLLQTRLQRLHTTLSAHVAPPKHSDREETTQVVPRFIEAPLRSLFLVARARPMNHQLPLPKKGEMPPAGNASPPLYSTLWENTCRLDRTLPPFPLSLPAR